MFPAPSGAPRLSALLNAAHEAGLLEAAYGLRLQRPESEEATAKGQRLRQLLCEDLYGFLRRRNVSENLRRFKAYWHEPTRTRLG